MEIFYNYFHLKGHSAQVITIHPSQYNIIRIATLKDNNGTYKRLVRKIVVLPYVNKKMPTI